MKVMHGISDHLWGELLAPGMEHPVVYVGLS